MSETPFSVIRQSSTTTTLNMSSKIDLINTTIKLFEQKLKVITFMKVEFDAAFLWCSYDSIYATFKCSEFWRVLYLYYTNCAWHNVHKKEDKIYELNRSNLESAVSTRLMYLMRRKRTMMTRTAKIKSSIHFLWASNFHFLIWLFKHHNSFYYKPPTGLNKWPWWSKSTLGCCAFGKQHLSFRRFVKWILQSS